MLGLYPVTLIIIAATCLVSIAAFSNHDLYGKMLFDPYLINNRKQWYRFFSHTLVHADVVHLGFNMLALYSIGQVVEAAVYPDLFGNKAMLYYVLLYVGGALFSSLWSYGKHKDNPHYAAVGASGAVSAVIFAFIIYAPWAQLSFFFIPMYAWVFGLLYMVASWYMGRRNIGNIGHDAHFWGAAFGFCFTLALEPSLFSSFIGKIIERF